MQTKSCQNCNKDFVIDQLDTDYYAKMNVPHPTWCPTCRFVRRMSTHNVWNVYWRNCDKCDKKMLSMYSKDKEITVYCNECWWADDWDGTEYATDYDPHRTFFEQLYELSRKTPWVAQEVIASTMVHSEYSNGASYLKNCFLTFWADYCENLNNSTFCLNFKDSSDCLRGYESELCYESVGFSRNFRTFFTEESDDCVDVWFSRNCYNCTNCIGCVNLRGASYCIFNEQYSKEEYAQKLAEFKLDTWSGIQKLKSQARAFWLTKPYRAYHGHSLNLNVSGDYVFESKNSHDLYLANGVEESRYCQFITVPKVKEAYDYSGWGANAEQIYEAHSSGENVTNIKFSMEAYTESMNIEYSIWTIAGKHNFGCTNLKRKQYCILNKQYSKEEYEALREKIIADMQAHPYIDPQGRTWTYGEFFPPMMSLFGYNESTAQRFFPKTQEAALAEGFYWAPETSNEYATTIKASELPETIDTTPQTICSEIIECETCAKAYKIGELEYMLLQKMHLPAPHSCPKCRMNSLFSRMNPIELHHRACQKCQTAIDTPYAPERPEIVYCVDCYQQELH